MFALLCLGAVLCGSTAQAGEVIIPLKSGWKYKKGTAEASSPVAAWRTLSYDDSSWLDGEGTFRYGRSSLAPGTELTDMRGAYTTLYVRKSFEIIQAADIDRLAMRVHIDDGFIAWINGREVARFNVADGEQPYNARSESIINPTWVTNSLSSPSEYLVEGRNVLAVQVFNRDLESSDIAFDLQLESTTDRNPPRILSVSPEPGQVSELRGIAVVFSEAVQGVSADDLLINNQPAEAVSGSGTTYTFSFPQPDFGRIIVSWDEGHFIEDFADPPHPFDHTADGASWEYTLQDVTAPFIESSNPPNGVTLRSLSEIELKANEPLSGVEPSDLLINGIPAQGLLVRPGNTYLFQFPPLSPGSVEIRFADDHSITDEAIPPNPLLAGPWNFTVDPDAPLPTVIISEFLTGAESTSGFEDEDGELQDWIEIHNTSAANVNLGGWSLTDDPEEPNLWVFPNVNLPANGRLVVFASGKDRRATGAGTRLHTNFKLGSEGEYLALFTADAPRVAMSEFSDYPEQRNDHSYGVDATGSWKYYENPTPGQANGSSTISGVVPRPEVNIERGTYETPFSLILTNDLPGVSIRYTLDGSPPTAASLLFTEPLTVGETTIFRAAGFRAGHLPSEVITHTYIFLEDVIRQPDNPPGFPVGSQVFTGYPSDYEMDPEVVNDPAYAPIIKNALAALPVMSVVMKMDDMFGVENGIYTHPLNRGPSWEKPCSLEFIQQDGSGFQVNAGIQVQGNAAREPRKNPKHPLRVVFKGDYGPKSLSYRMFPDSPASKFDTLILRADFNFSWLHWNPNQRNRAQRTRDSWMKDTMRAMGGLASHNRYVHLYINGLYWGIYDPSERPDGSFGEAYLGGDKEDYDVMNEGAVVDGSSSAYNTMVNLPAPQDLATYESYKQYLDIPQFIDYMLLHFYVGHTDWFVNKNWYAIRPKDGSSGFKYVPWDGEMMLDNPNENRVTSSDLPSGLHPKLISSEQYRMDFADHAHRHFFNGGALTPPANIARWMERAREVELPIVAESARWGDYRRDVHQFQNPPYEFYTRDNQWRTEQTRLVGSYFPSRTGTVLNQLRSAGLYPNVAAPSFNRHGGRIDPGFLLTMSAPNSAIYYTTNGVDPRVYGSGALSPQAMRYAGPVALEGTVRVKARVLNGSTWSALNEAVFTSDGPRVPIRITEIMYNPPGDAYEYLELQNFGPLEIDLSGYYLTGIDYVFPPRTMIAPGQIFVLASGDNPAAFTARYPGVPVAGHYAGQLVNRGERLALVSPKGQTIVSVDYDDELGWPVQADGQGASLEITHPFGDPDDPANWKPSALNGSPGKSNPAAEPAPVVFNEVFATGGDWIELVNRSEGMIFLGGWSISEARDTSRFVFPAGTQLAGGEMAVIHCDNLTNSPGFHAPFALDRDGETLVLRNEAGATIDMVTFGPQAADHSFGQINGIFSLTEPTPLAPNVAAPLGEPSSLVINEWLADSVAGESDWVEIYNRDAANPVALNGLYFGGANILFEVTAQAFVAPGGYVRLFADEKPGPNHLDFKLPSAGMDLAILDAAGTMVHSTSFGAQEEGVSGGRFPDGASSIVQFPVSPSPGRPNTFDFPITFEVSDAGEFTLSWPSVPQRSYRVEFSQTLRAGEWETVEEVVAAGQITVTKESTENSRRYYRVVALP